MPLPEEAPGGLGAEEEPCGCVAGSGKARRAWIKESAPPTTPSPVSDDGPSPAFAGLRRPALAVDDGDDTLDGVPSPLERLGTGAESLDNHQARGGGLAVEELEQGRQTATHSLDPLRGVAVGRDHNRRDPIERLVEGGQEAVFAVEELLVERAPRDAGAGHDTSDGGISDPVLGGHVHYGRNDPGALDLGELFVPVGVSLAFREAPSAGTLAGSFTEACMSYALAAGLRPGGHRRAGRRPCRVVHVISSWSCAWSWPSSSPCPWCSR